jgi:hypothetical protein
MFPLFLGGLIGTIGKVVGTVIPGKDPIEGIFGRFGSGGASPQLRQFPERSVVPGARCNTGFYWNGQRCVPLETRKDPGITGFGQRMIPGGESGLMQFGEAVLGQYGAALEPGVRPTETLICPRGTVLGTDNLCYNKRDIRNDERKWPRGRRPLLTGGEMRCISIASRAAGKLQRKQKQLQDLGMLKKPAPRRRAPKQITAGTPGVQVISAGE